MPFQELAEPEPGPELYCVFVGLCILKVLVTHVLQTSGPEQAHDFLSHSPSPPFPAVPMNLEMPRSPSPGGLASVCYSHG